MRYEDTVPIAVGDETLLEETAVSARTLDLVLRVSADLIVPAIWVALIIAIVLFSGVVSQFRYVDF